MWISLYKSTLLWADPMLTRYCVSSGVSECSPNSSSSHQQPAPTPTTFHKLRKGSQALELELANALSRSPEPTTAVGATFYKSEVRSSISTPANLWYHTILVEQSHAAAISCHLETSCSNQNLCHFLRLMLHSSFSMHLFMIWWKLHCDEVTAKCISRRNIASWSSTTSIVEMFLWVEFSSLKRQC